MTALRPYAYSHDGVTLTGQLAEPTGPGPHPAVLVMHSALGQGPLERKRAQDLADAGYVALAADMYGFETSEDTWRQAMAAFKQSPELARSRMVATYEAVRALPQVDPSRICAIGFCFGGECVLELARSGLDVAAVVSFHGGLLTKSPAARGSVKAKILVITGALDPYAPASDVEAFEKEMTEAEADWQMTIYGQGEHGFTNPSARPRPDYPGVRYDAMLDRLSWAQSNAFLEACLER
jgi:dienelactone hydrolase